MVYSHDLMSHDGHSCDCCTAVPELTSVSGNGKWREHSQRIASTAGVIVPPHRHGGQGHTWVDYFYYLGACRAMPDGLASETHPRNLGCQNGLTGRYLCSHTGLESECALGLH